jgi:hypothetical protein
MTGGVVASAACFGIAIALELLGRSADGDTITDPRAIADAIAALRPWGFAAVGSLLVIATPALALVGTAWEYASRQERAVAATALLVLAVLAASLAIALLA